MWDVFHGVGRELEMLLEGSDGPQLEKTTEFGPLHGCGFGPVVKGLACKLEISP